MRLLKNITIYGTVVSLCAVVAVYAQPKDKNNQGSDKSVLAGDRTAKISPGQMKKQSRATLDKMSEALERIVQLQQVARKQKDVIKLNCINDKLLQVKQLINIGEGARANLLEAIQRKDEDERYHQFSQVTISGEKTSSLRADAEACIGEDLVYVGPTNTDVTGPDIPDDPTEGDDETLDDVGIEDPGYTSPFQ